VSRRDCLCKDQVKDCMIVLVVFHFIIIEGNSRNKLQNDVILSIFKIRKKSKIYMF